MIILQENEENIEDIVAALDRGAVLVLPTDTVYGLVCDATNKSAVEKIFKIKDRNKSKPLPVFIEDVEMAKNYAVIDEAQEIFLKKSWPGPTTLVLKAKKGLSPLIYKDDTVALRQPDYELVIRIIKLLGKPLAQTSANISGKPATTKIKEVLDNFRSAKSQPDIITDSGDLPERSPSRVIDLTGIKPKIIRA